MITRWKISNFKSVRDADLEFGPITIIAGPNSSGKSSLIQSMLLVGQTMTSRVLPQSIVLNGTLTKLGQFDDLKSYGSSTDAIMVGFESHPQEMPEYFESNLVNLLCTFSFDADPSGRNPALAQVQPRLYQTRVQCSSRSSETGALDRYWIVATRVPSSQTILPTRPSSPVVDDSVLPDDSNTNADFKIELDPISMGELREGLASASPVGCRLRHFIPTGLLVRFDKRQEIARFIALAVSDPGRMGRAPRHLTEKDLTIPREVLNLIGQRAKHIFVNSPVQSLFLSSGPVPLRDWTDKIRQLPYGKRLDLRKTLQGIGTQVQELVVSLQDPSWSETVRQLPSEELLDAANYFYYLFANCFRYLGPLRDEPKSLYPLSASLDPFDVGLKGEHTAAVLHIHKNLTIRYVPADCFESADIKCSERQVTLEEAVLDWLRYLDVAQSISTEDKGKFGHELKVSVPDMQGSHDLTHVGVGVSQVLPILVMCLLADVDTTLVFEQPELHLHPKVQTRLADFFLSVALQGKQCVIETHSEYLINRLRFRAASAQGSEVAEKIKTYFVEKRNNMSKFRPVEVNQYGAIPAWPEGFFDESQKESEEILLAASKKLNRERGNGGSDH